MMPVIIFIAILTGTLIPKIFHRKIIHQNRVSILFHFQTNQTITSLPQSFLFFKICTVYSPMMFETFFKRYPLCSLANKNNKSTPLSWCAFVTRFMGNCMSAYANRNKIIYLPDLSRSEKIILFTLKATIENETSLLKTFNTETIRKKYHT